MPSKDVTINLIGEEEMGHSPVGRIVSWAVTYGRYIMIGTEVVVLLAFISRFSLDRKLTDLNDDVFQKQSIIEANLEFEREFLVVQNHVHAIEDLLTIPNTALAILDALQTKLPTDGYLESLTVTGTSVAGSAVVRSPTSLSYLISTLQTTSPITHVDIGDVKRRVGHGIQFEFTAALAGQKKK